MLYRILVFFSALTCATAYAETPREVIAKAAVLDDSEQQAKLVQSLADSGSPDVGQLLTLWKEGGIFLLDGPKETKIAVTLGLEKDVEQKQAVFRFDTSAPVLDEAGKPLRALASDLNNAETDSLLRTAMKSVMDLAQLSSADVKQRLRSVETLGMEQNPERLPVLLLRQEKETDSRVKRALREAIALTKIKDEDPAKQIAACRELGAIGSIPSQDILKQVVKDGTPEVQAAATSALKEIAAHVRTVDTVGTLFRGLSAGSILLVVAIGLAITFGLMGVINMAHGEMIAIGAYTTYIVQCVFGPGLEVSPFGFHINLPGMNATGWHYDCYFVVTIPLS